MNKKFIISFTILMLTILAGTFSYPMLVDEPISYLDSLYMTFITITTVGYEEIVDLGPYPAARILTMVLILIGMGNLLFVVSTLTSVLIGDQLKDILWRRKIMKKINEYTDHYIVCGAGDTGLHIIDELIKANKDFIVIENNLEAYENLKHVLHDIPIIFGDATQDGVLEKAHILDANAIVSALPFDKDNLFLIITAKQLNPELRIVSKIMSLENQKKLIRAGANSVVPPRKIGALRMASELLRPNVVTFLDVMLRDKSNIRLEEITVTAKSKLIGKTLKEVKIPNKIGLQVVALKKAEDIAFNYTPKCHDTLEENMVIVSIGTPEKMIELDNYLNN